MLTRIGLSAVLALSACMTTEYTDVYVELTHAEVHIDTGQPDALAEPTILLDVYGGAEVRYISLEGAWLTLDDGVTKSLDLGFDDPAVEVPANSYLLLSLVNRGLRNSDLVGYCQRSLPLTAYVGLPADPELAFQSARALAVFCP